MKVTYKSVCPGKRQYRSCHYFISLNSITKRLWPIVVFLFFLSQAQATIKTATGNAGQGWSNASNWSPSGVPQNGDTVIIPVGITISVKGQIYSSPYPTILIKIYGTLDFDPSGKIDLSSASAIGILTGANLTTNGTSSEIITIGGSTKFNGQLDGNLVGPKYASASTGSSPGGFVPGVLPIRLLSFNYKIAGNKVTLTWTVVQESDEDVYEVQRSNNSEDWQIISTVLPRGMAGETLSYSFEDANASNKINFYRLNLKSIDGTSKYSKVLAVNLNNSNSSVIIFPNPVSSMARLQWNDANENGIRIIVYDNSGKMRVNKAVTGNFINLDTHELSNGVYEVLFFVGEELRNSTLMLVRK
jgi:hypothetical protein